VPLAELGAPRSDPQDEDSATVRARVLNARTPARPDAGGRPNAEISTRELERDCALGPAERRWFDAALERLGLSARAYHRTCVSRAPLPISITVPRLLDRTHLAEALQYRRLSLISD
jgi:magnesium chelatase family protein